MPPPPVGTPAADVVITPALVRSLLARHQPSLATSPLTPIGEGWDNVTYRVGDALAVRLPRREVAAALLLHEQRWLPRLAPTLPLPIPEIVAVGGADADFPFPWSVVRWLEGDPVDLLPLRADQGPPLARFLRALHAPAPAEAPRNPFRGGPLQARATLTDASLGRLRQVTDLITPAIDRLWRDALDAPAFDGPPAWLHGDLHSQNVLARDGALAGVLDWGDLGAGDPAVDLGGIWGLLDAAAARAEALDHYRPDAASLARARGWAVRFGVTLVEHGRVDDPRHAAQGEAILRRLHEDARS